MMIFAFFLLGGLAGIFAWLYIDRFIPNLQQEIYQNYIELYPENRPIFHSEKAAIQSQKCGHIFLYFLGFGLCFAVLDYFLHFIIISIIFARSDGDNDRNMRMRCAVFQSLSFKPIVPHCYCQNNSAGIS